MGRKNFLEESDGFDHSAQCDCSTSHLQARTSILVLVALSLMPDTILHAYCMGKTCCSVLLVDPDGEVPILRFDSMFLVNDKHFKGLQSLS